MSYMTSSRASGTHERFFLQDQGRGYRGEREFSTFPLADPAIFHFLLSVNPHKKTNADVARFSSGTGRFHESSIHEGLGLLY